MNDGDTKAQLIRAVRWILIPSVGVALLFFAVRPLHRMANGWRARTFWKNAREAIARGEWTEAHRQIQLGVQLRRDLPDGYRLLAQMFDARGGPAAGQSVPIWKMTLQTGQAADSDRVALGEAALRENLLPLAEEQVNLLLAHPVISRESYHLAGLVAVRQQKIALACQWFQKALETDSGYARAALNLARTEAFYADSPETLKRGLDRLQSMASRLDEWGLESLRLLAEWVVSHPSHSQFDPQLAEQLRQHPRARISDQCLAAEWELKKTADSKKREAVLERLTASVSQLSKNDQRDLAAWINRQKMPQKTLAVFPLTSDGPEDLLLAQLDAMADLGRWKELDQFLAQSLFPSQPVLLWLFRARVARELGHAKRFEINWHRAVTEAGQNPQALRYLVDYALKLGEIGRGIEACEMLSRQPDCELEALLRLISLYERLGQTHPSHVGSSITRSLFQTIQRIRSIRPMDPAVLNDVAYLGLLLDESPAQFVELAGEVYALNPRLPSFAATYALSRLRSGSPAAALEAVREFSTETWTAPGWQAVYAATLAANGRKADAIHIAKSIDSRLLKPEEAGLISPFWSPAESRAKSRSARNR